MAPSPFSVAGMASTSSAHHNHNQNLNTWGGASTSGHGQLTNSFTDTLSQSRSHYQPGYILSTSQSNGSPTGAQRVDEAPIVQTKAKMNSAFSSDFGMDSMFQSTRQRQTLADEDAPPTSSVNDIPTEMHADAGASSQPRNSAFARSTRALPAPAQSSQSQSAPMLYIIVFGYPPDKYSIAVSYFQGLGAAGAPDPHTEIVNCFRIGYRDPADAMRAVRKNGEVLGGSWMVGVKWADPAQADAVLNQPVGARHASPISMSVSADNDMAIDTPAHSSAYATPPTVGTPIKLAPSASAFRRGANNNASARPAPTTPQQGGGAAAGAGVGVVGAGAGAGGGTPGKGVLGQVSDMIFGW